MFANALVQYNSTTRRTSANVRLRWEYRPESELFVVYNEERDTRARGFPGLQNRAFIVKINRLFRFSQPTGRTAPSSRRSLATRRGDQKAGVCARGVRRRRRPLAAYGYHAIFVRTRRRDGNDTPEVPTFERRGARPSR